MYDAICLSDIHLGAYNCQAKSLEIFLKDIYHENLKTKELILNGDVFDTWDLRRLKKHHWHILSQIRKLSDRIKITWCEGNHDAPAVLISHLLGVDVFKSYSIVSGNKSIYFHHGHRYDEFIDNHPIITNIADSIYWLLQKIDPSFVLARLAKKNSKTFLRNSEIIKKKSLEYGDKHGYDIVCTGHTHYAIAKPEIGYYNSGSWTELPCHFLLIKNGNVELLMTN